MPICQERVYKKAAEKFPPLDTLCVDQKVVHYLHSSIPDVVHLLHPQYLILSLELFCDVLTGGHLFYPLKEHILCLLVQISQITVQLAGDL